MFEHVNTGQSLGSPGVSGVMGVHGAGNKEPSAETSKSIRHEPATEAQLGLSIWALTADLAAVVTHKHV